MKYELIAKRYAKALISNIQQDKFDSFLKDNDYLNRLFKENPVLVDKIDSILIPIKKREKLAKEIAENLFNSKIWFNLFSILILKKKFSLITSILIIIEKMIFAKRDQEKVILKLAHKHPVQTIAGIERLVRKIIQKEVISQIMIDPDLLGGFTAETESLFIDGSIRNHLVKFKNIIYK